MATTTPALDRRPRPVPPGRPTTVETTNRPAARPPAHPATRGASRLRRLAALLPLVALVALVGCGSDTSQVSTASAPDNRAGAAAVEAEPTVAGPSSSSAAVPAAAADAPSHAVAVARGPVAVHQHPDAASAATSLAATTTLGTERTFRVVESTADGAWLRVLVASRPNHTAGWVRASAVSLVAVRHHVEIDLSERTLVLREEGEPVLVAPVAIGTAENPTPTGSFFVTDKLATDPTGAYGPYAFGVAAWSETLSEFAGGDGQIGLHGTNQPELLGDAVSHGCIRVDNDVVTALAAVLPLGVPVEIRA